MREANVLDKMLYTKYLHKKRINSHTELVVKADLSEWESKISSNWKAVVKTF